jgi:hypothetical protein
MFAIQLGIPRHEVLDLSIPQMVDYLDHWSETVGGQGG